MLAEISKSKLSVMLWIKILQRMYVASYHPLGSYPVTLITLMTKDRTTGAGAMVEPLFIKQLI